MTHTPGPWRRGTGRDSVVCDTEIKQFNTADELSLGAYGGHLVAESVATNNLDIIAAAPDLLAALEHVAAVLGSPEYRSWMERVVVVDATLLTTNMPRVDIMAVRDAIAKARGRS